MRPILSLEAIMVDKNSAAQPGLPNNNASVFAVAQAFTAQESFCFTRNIASPSSHDALFTSPSLPLQNSSSKP
jgi:hypothetical protein